MAENNIGPKIGIDGEKQFRDSLNAINAQMRSLAAEMKAVTAEFAENANSEEALAARNDVLARSVETAKNKLSTLDGQLDRQRGKLNELSDELDRAAAEYGENSEEAARAQNAYNRQFRVVADLERQYNQTREQLADFERQMRDAGDASDETTDQLNAQNLVAAQAAWEGIKAAVSAVANALQEAIQVGMEFDASVADIAATMGTTVDSLGDLRGFAQEMGATTAFTATEAAQALNYMALAGYDAQESMEALPNVLNLAAAGGVELASASDMVTDAQSALGLSMEQTAVLVDKMAKTSTKTNTSVAQLGEAILTVGGTAQFMAGGTQELNQVLGVLADNSIKGSEGGTKLRNIILSLSAPTEKAAKTLDDLGVSVFDAEGDMRRFSDIFPDLQRGLSSLTDQDQIAALSEIFNSRDLAAAQALLGTTAERWEELSAAIDGAAGSAQQMAETRLDNLAGDITLLQSAADGARIAFSDSLTPALRTAAQAGTGVLTFVGGLVQEVPLAGQALAGLTAAGLTLGVGLAASAAGITSVTEAVGALTTALATNPFGQLALAVGLGVTALGALAGALDEAGKKTTETARAVEESREAFEGQKAAIADQRQNMEDLAAQLEDLAGKENRTAGEKARLLEITQQLNQAVPGLGLSYDELNDTLNMTTEQVLALARAQADAQERQETAAAVVQAEKNHAAAVRELELAELDLQKALEAKAEAQRQGWYGDMGSIEATGELDKAVKTAQKTVNELEQAVTDSADHLEEMNARLEELAAGAEDTAESVEETGEAAESAGAALDDLSVDVAGLEEATLYAAGAADTLTDALSEQEKQGSLSLETANDLIAAGYGAAIAIDQETGAVTLNREEYVRLASAKLQAQLATLEAQKASIEAARKAAVEEAAVRADGSAYWDAAKAKAAMAHADDLQALELQIAALNRAQQSLNSYGTASTSAAAKSAGASQKIKTQAEEDLEEYKTLQAELEHQQSMGLISDQEYYRQLAQLRDQYLSDAANIDQYRKVSETIYKADQKALQEREKLWQSASDGILKLEEDFQKELSDRAAEIVSSYKLFDEVPEYQKVSGQELIRNLENQIDAIEAFYGNVAALEERGVDAALVDEIRKMGVSASGELEGLLSLTDEQLSKYSDLYGEKQALANEIAVKELGGLRNQTNEEILAQLDDVAALYDTNAPALGIAFANSLAEGMFEGMPAVEAMAQTVAAAAMSAFENTYNRDVEAMMTSSKGSRVTADDLGELFAGAVNGINAGSAGGAYPPLDVTLSIDDQILSRALVDPMRQAFREKPENLDDKK